MTQQRNKLGFTLIELLVTIAIIGVLATLAIVNLSSIRVKARDTKRLADIKQIQLALELYYDNNNIYPEIVNSGVNLVDGANTYMSPVPYNPLPNDGTCPANENYVYTQRDNGASYTLTFCIGNELPDFSSGPHIATPLGTNDVAVAEEEEESEITPPSCGVGFDVSYSGEIYPTVLINDQCWLKKNLNIGDYWPGADPQPDANAGVIKKYCYENIAGNCAILGGLYQWHTAMALPAVCDNQGASAPCIINSTHQGICPPGWHIPNENEWNILAKNVSGDLNCDPSSGCAPAGYNLKITAPTWDGSNSSNFSALPSGYRGNNGTFINITNRANFWSTLINGNANAYRRYLNNANDKLTPSDDKKIYGYSVRCLKD